MDILLNAAHKKDFVAEFRSRLRRVDKLPALNKVASELLKLRSNPQADVKDLVAIVETDPVITLQILRYCRLSSFGYGERIQSLEDAISLVLGFDRALHLALGVSAGKSLSMQSKGVLGRHSLWNHSLQTAILCQELARCLAPSFQVSPGAAYLGGLLHDIGFLLLGHMYPREFREFNKLVEKYRQKEVRELELLYLGVSHDMTGLHLMRAWQMPEEICISVGEHHFPEYEGKYAAYSKIVFLANSIMGHNDAHDRVNNYASVADLMQQLQLSDEHIDKALQTLESINKEVDDMAKEMAA